MNKLTFRTIFGGPKMPRAFVDELDDIKKQLSSVSFDYHLDLGLTIGGDIVEVTHPTGLRSPRIHIEDKRVTGTIFVSNNDSMRPMDHRLLLRNLVHDSVSEIFDRMAAKKIDFSKNEHVEKIGFLKVK